jgi:hypothetical protein
LYYSGVCIIEVKLSYEAAMPTAFFCQMGCLAGGLMKRGFKVKEALDPHHSQNPQTTHAAENNSKLGYFAA